MNNLTTGFVVVVVLFISPAALTHSLTQDSHGLSAMSPRRTLCYYCPVNGCVTRIHPAANNPLSTLPSHSSGTQSSIIQVCDYRPTVFQMPLVSTPLDLDPAPSVRLSVCLPAEAACACAAPVTCEWILRTIPPETMIKNPKWRLYIVYKCPFFKVLYQPNR